MASKIAIFQAILGYFDPQNSIKLWPSKSVKYQTEKGNTKKGFPND
jgi:hypothetical protein